MSIDYSFLDSIEERVEAEIQDWLEFLDYESYIAATAATLATEKKLSAKELQEELQRTFKSIESNYRNRCPKDTAKPDYASKRIERNCKQINKRFKKLRKYVTSNKKVIQKAYTRSIRIARAS